MRLAIQFILWAGVSVLSRAAFPDMTTLEHIYLLGAFVCLSLVAYVEDRL